MKWLFAFLAVFFIVAPAMAGEDPYIAIVGNDAVLGTAAWDLSIQQCRPAANPFYFSPKYQQFLYDQTGIGVPICDGTFPPQTTYTRADAWGVVPGSGCEQFRSQTPTIQDEICLTRQGYLLIESGEVCYDGECDNEIYDPLKNAKTPAGNAGWYEWWIRLPKKPSGEINIVIECGVVKPNAYAVYGHDSVTLCAAETGERIGYGVCVRQEVDPGTSPIINTALPKITAIAYPGPYNAFAPFNLTAWKNPSAYTLIFDAITQAMSNNGNSQVLDGGSNARILLKACMDKTIVTKLPVTGQINALGQSETDLEAGDFIYVRMDVPRQNTVDIYCHAQSARLMGVGEAPF